MRDDVLWHLGEGCEEWVKGRTGDLQNLRRADVRSHEVRELLGKYGHELEDAVLKVVREMAGECKGGKGRKTETPLTETLTKAMTEAKRVVMWVGVLWEAGKGGWGEAGRAAERGQVRQAVIRAKGYLKEAARQVDEEWSQDLPRVGRQHSRMEETPNPERGSQGEWENWWEMQSAVYDE
eukprot:7291323-Pyramimonas_sp.AAC.1